MRLLHARWSSLSLSRRRWPSPSCFLAYGSLDRQLLGAGNRFDFLEKNIFEKKCQFSLIFRVLVGLSRLSVTLLAITEKKVSTL